MFDLSAVVTCDADLEAAVGERSEAMLLKSIGYLDDHCQVLLAHAPFVVVGTTAAGGGMRAFALGGEPGVVSPIDEHSLDLGAGDGRDLVDGAPAGLIALVPGMGETLRVNGRLRVDGHGDVRLEVEEALLHCAKAMMRSELWADWSDRSAGSVQEAHAFLAASPFVLLASVDGDGHADVSPKGDPAGLVHAVDDGTLVIADRPGNGRTDTLHNLMARPEIALLALGPGRGEVVEVRGRASVCVDEALLATLELRNRQPKAAIVIDVDHIELRPEPAIAAASLWDRSRHVDRAVLPRPAAVWADHVRRTRETGPLAEMMRDLIDEESMATGVAADYETNL